VSRCEQRAATRAQRASAAGDRGTLCAVLAALEMRTRARSVAPRLVLSSPRRDIWSRARTWCADATAGTPRALRLPLVASCARPAAAGVWFPLDPPASLRLSILNLNLLSKGFAVQFLGKVFFEQISFQKRDVSGRGDMSPIQVGP
jgi:hypothetical protein